MIKLSDTLLAFVVNYTLLFRLLAVVALFTLTFLDSWIYLIFASLLPLLLGAWVLLSVIEHKDWPLRSSGAYIMAFPLFVLFIVHLLFVMGVHFYTGEHIYPWIAPAFRFWFGLLILLYIGILLFYVIYQLGLTWPSDQLPHPKSLDEISRMSIESFDKEVKVELTQEEIQSFLAYLKKGRLSKILKAYTHYEIKVWQGDSYFSYYLHHDTLGSQPGGMSQVVFRPQKEGLYEFLHAVELKHESLS